MSILSIFKKKPELARDPMCHMLVDPSKARASSKFEGVTYYFCAPGCKILFEEDPGKHITSEKPAIEM